MEYKIKNIISKEQRKPTRTISGVAPLAVMLPPKKCSHGVCLFCPTLNAPQSYTPESPAVLRASALKYDAYKQIIARLKSFKSMKHPTDKIELIIMGGTFLSFPVEFQYKFIKDCYDALNGKKSKNLEEAKKVNEQAETNRCVALCIETRPDICNENEIKRMLEFGATRVELGVQAIDDKIYRMVNRGHNVKDVITATEKLKKAGFKVGYHIMPGILGSNPKKDLIMFRKLFSSQDFRPDQLKIYPCQVLKGAELEKLYYQGKYKPYGKDETEELVIKLLKATPEYCRVMRIMREIPPAYLVAGIINIDLRKNVEDKIRKNKIQLKEIRFREVGFELRDKRKLNQNIKIKKLEYNASGGREIFLQAINKDSILFGLLRLRLEKSEKEPALVRELHVYGPALNLGEEGKISQHIGLGKKLMQEAEKIARQLRYKKIRVISGVGVREYYKHLNYRLDKNGIYMDKEIKYSKRQK
jgi:elongator complex protein 3